MKQQQQKTSKLLTTVLYGTRGRMADFRHQAYVTGVNYTNPSLPSNRPSPSARRSLRTGHG